MCRFEIIVIVLSTCVIHVNSVKLNLWFLMDINYDINSAYHEIVVAPELIWRRLKRSGLLGNHLANNYTVAKGGCSLDGAKEMVGKLNVQDMNNIHGVVGPICPYLCDLTGLIFSSFYIPQVYFSGQFFNESIICCILAS